MSVQTPAEPQTGIAREQRAEARTPIRLGLLLDERFTPQWVADLMAKLRQEVSIELAGVVCTGRHEGHSPADSWLFRLWSKLDERLFREKCDPLGPATAACNVETINLDDREDEKLQLSASDLRRLQASGFDILLHMGSAALPAEFSSCAKHGVWTFHYEGYTPQERESSIFWHLFNGESSSELVLTSNDGARKVIYRGVFSNDLISWKRNLILDCRRRSQILARCLSKVFSNGWNGLSDLPEDATSARSVHPSMSSVMPRFIARWIGRAFQRLWTRIGFHEQWFMAYGKVDTASLVGTPNNQLGLNRFTLVRPSVGKNYADPFLFEHNRKTYLFFEEYDKGQPGVICCAEFNADGTLGAARQVLATGYHLSYPSIFEWRGQIYMLPESQENGTVEIYRAIDFPYQWEHAGVLLNNVRAADPTIFDHNGKLWLFAAGFGAEGSESTELSLFWSDSLFGEWHPHPKNPIVCDVRRARPAGSLFFDKGSLIRPGQDCSLRYGYAISLNRVDELSETDYREVPVESILPEWMAGICSTHTLNKLGEITVLDARALVPRLPFLGSLFRQS